MLGIATACRHGQVIVSPSDIAIYATELNERGDAELPARKQKWSYDWSSSKTTVRRDHRVTVSVSSVETGEAETFTGVLKLTIGELLADCPPMAFTLDEATRRAHPRCKLLGVGDDPITVGTTTFPGPIFWGALGASVGLGIVACAAYCDSPFGELSTGVVVVGSVVAVVAVVGIAALVAKSR